MFTALWIVGACRFVPPWDEWDDHRALVNLDPDEIVEACRGAAPPQSCEDGWAPIPCVEGSVPEACRATLGDLQACVDALAAESVEERCDTLMEEACSYYWEMCEVD